MTDTPKPTRPCSAQTAGGKPCTQQAINGLDVPLCASHSRPHKAGRRPKHGYYASSNLDQLEYLHRVRPEDWVQGGGLLHKMEILDALIFRAREHELDITLLLSLYLAATSRLGRMVIERDDRAAGEHGDLLALLERASEELENREGSHGP